MILSTTLGGDGTTNLGVIIGVSVGVPIAIAIVLLVILAGSLVLLIFKLRSRRMLAGLDEHMSEKVPEKL